MALPWCQRYKHGLGIIITIIIHTSKYVKEIWHNAKQPYTEADVRTYRKIMLFYWMCDLTITLPKDDLGSYVLRCTKYLHVFELGAIFVYTTLVQVRCNYSNPQFTPGPHQHMTTQSYNRNTKHAQTHAYVSDVTSTRAANLHYKLLNTIVRLNTSTQQPLQSVSPMTQKAAERTYGS